jgi:hypothetical protein
MSTYEIATLILGVATLAYTIWYSQRNKPKP